MDVADLAADLVAADAHAETERTIRRGQSAFLDNMLADAAPSLISRNAARESRQIMTRSSTAATNSFSTFLDKPKDEPSGAPAAGWNAVRQSAATETPVFRPGKGGLERKSSSAFVRGAALLGKKGSSAALLGKSKGKNLAPPKPPLPGVTERASEGEGITQHL